MTVFTLCLSLIMFYCHESNIYIYIYIPTDIYRLHISDIAKCISFKFSL